MDEFSESHLSVSGISTSEGDALSKLLAASRPLSRQDGNAANDGFAEALRKIVDKPVFLPEGDSIKSEDVSVSLRKPPKPISKPLPAPKKPLSTPSNTEFQLFKSQFHAENPDNIDFLPPLSELVHPKLRRPLMEHLTIKELTRIQKLSWEAVLDRTRDVLIRSETGSGKTLAYALPLLHHLLCDCDKQPLKRDVGTVIIVMCPTRELVSQVTETLTILTRGALFLTVGGIHGGDNRHKEKARLRKGIPILVATPGRLLDHLKSTLSFRIDAIQSLVMDEADRILDLGFEKAIREIMELILAKKSPTSPDLKRILVSATITDGVERLSHFALREKVIRIGETQDTFSVPSTLRQHYVSVPVKHRLAVLLTFLRSQLDAGAKKIVVFVSTADAAEFLYILSSRLESPFRTGSAGAEGRLLKRSSMPKNVKKLTHLANQHITDNETPVITFEDDDLDEGRNNLDSAEENLLSMKDALVNANIFKLHGNMAQVDRAAVFHAFKFGVSGSDKPSYNKSVLFCTDVAARGLDMPQIDWIVHYDPPMDPACYVHRIGRTARIGNTGDSILFLLPHEVEYAKYLSNFLEVQQSGGVPPQMMVEKKYEVFLFYLTKLDPRAGHMWMNATSKLEYAISRMVMHREGGDYSEDDLHRVALFAYQSYLRAYAGAPKALRGMFFQSEQLHLGHVAHSFGIDKSPSELQRQLKGLIRSDRNLSRETKDNSNGTSGSRKRLRVEIDNTDRYRSMITQRQRRVTRDWHEEHIKTNPVHKPLQHGEFDAI